MTKEVWEHFSEEQLCAFLRLCEEGDGDGASIKFLANILDLPNYNFQARDAIKLDYASNMLEFAREQKYGPIRTASLFNISHNVLRACIAGASLPDAEATVKSELIAVCRAKPGADSPFISPEQVARIGKHLARTFFSHYRLYQYCFSQDQDLTEYTDCLLVETPTIPTFEAALPDAEWKAQVEEARAQGEAAENATQAAAAAAAGVEQQAQMEKDRAEAHTARLAELAKKPATLEEAVEKMVGLRLEKERVALAAEYKVREDVLVQKIEVLEGKARPLTPEVDGKKAEGKKK